MNINKLKKEVHDILIKTDKYKCPECGGCGEIFSSTFGEQICPACDISGIHADTSKLLMDIISQLVFALEKWEYNERTIINNYIKYKNQGTKGKDLYYLYKATLLGTHEDHLSHAFILLLDFAEYKNRTIYDYTPSVDMSMHETMYNIITNLENLVSSISIAIGSIIYLCKQQNIDIEKHVKARLEYMRSEQ